MGEKFRSREFGERESIQALRGRVVRSHRAARRRRASAASSPIERSTGPVQCLDRVCPGMIATLSWALGQWDAERRCPFVKVGATRRGQGDSRESLPLPISGAAARAVHLIKSGR